MIKKLLLAAVVIAVLSFVIEMPLVFFGWMSFLGRNVPRVGVNPGAVASGVLFFALAVAAIHGCGVSFCRALSAKSAAPRKWRFRWTLMSLAGVVVLFVAGLSTIGLARHVGWMFSKSDPTYKETVDYKEEL